MESIDTRRRTGLTYVSGTQAHNLHFALCSTGKHSGPEFDPCPFCCEISQPGPAALNGKRPRMCTNCFTVGPFKSTCRACMGGCHLHSVPEDSQVGSHTTDSGPMMKCTSCFRVGDQHLSCPVCPDRPWFGEALQRLDESRRWGSRFDGPSALTCTEYILRCNSCLTAGPIRQECVSCSNGYHTVSSPRSSRCPCRHHVYQRKWKDARSKVSP